MRVVHKFQVLLAEHAGATVIAINGGNGALFPSKSPFSGSRLSISAAVKNFLLAIEARGFSLSSVFLKPSSEFVVYGHPKSASLNMASQDNSYLTTIAIGFAVAITFIAVILRLLARRLTKLPMGADDYTITRSNRQSSNTSSTSLNIQPRRSLR